MSAYRAYLWRLRGDQRAGMTGLADERWHVEATFPVVARHVKWCWRIEIGEYENLCFVVREIGCGGLDFEDDRSGTLAEAMEAGLTRWFEEQGVDLDD